MSQYFPVVLLLGLSQLCVCIKLFVRAVSWIRKHPGGADPGDTFLGLLWVAGVTGILVSALLLIPVFSVIISLGLSWMALPAIGICILALGPSLPALGLTNGNAKKANLLALFSGASLACSGLLVTCFFLVIFNT